MRAVKVADDADAAGDWIVIEFIDALCEVFEREGNGAFFEK